MSSACYRARNSRLIRPRTSISQRTEDPHDLRTPRSEATTLGQRFFSEILWIDAGLSSESNCVPARAHLLRRGSQVRVLPGAPTFAHAWQHERELRLASHAKVLARARRSAKREGGRRAGRATFRRDNPAERFDSSQAHHHTTSWIQSFADTDRDDRKPESNLIDPYPC
jgi:hypothetical protein